MNDVIREYGAALFMVACEDDAKEEYGKALDALEKAFEESPEYLEFLVSPGIPLSERLSAIETAFADFVPVNVLSFIQLMCEKGRVDGFFGAAKEYRELLDASKQIVNAKVTSAVELTDDEKKKLYEKLKVLSRGDVATEYFVDGSILGGLIVELDGKIMDGSLRRRLRDVKDVIN